MGVEGAAIATSLGRGLAVVYQFVMLGQGKREDSFKMETYSAKMGRQLSNWSAYRLEE